PARLNRRPAGLPTAQCLRSASMVNGAPAINSQSEAALKPSLTVMGVPDHLWERTCRIVAPSRWSLTITRGTW
ncbi:hypothetical protein DM828_00740, partial [Pseudomonas umsongensis]|nr:hypothetical protein [Pseudomonas umsongensis]